MKKLNLKSVRASWQFVGEFIPTPVDLSPVDRWIRKATENNKKAMEKAFRLIQEKEYSLMIGDNKYILHKKYTPGEYRVLQTKRIGDNLFLVVEAIPVKSVKLEELLKQYEEDGPVQVLYR
jgi:hypothetical protein